MTSGMFSAEQLEIRALAREFAEGELRPHTSRWDRDRALDDDIFGKLAELGFLGMRVPERYGGLGLDMSTYLLALEELAWGDASVALSVAIHTGPVTDLLLEYGSDEQKETWLSSLASGEILGAFALSTRLPCPRGGVEDRRPQALGHQRRALGPRFRLRHHRRR